MTHVYRFLPLVFLLNPLYLLAQLDWQPNVELNQSLPPGITVFETIDEIAEEVPTHAVYVRADLSDAGLDFRAVLAEGGARTPLQFAEESFATDRDSVYVSINGGFFSSTQSFSLVVNDGELLSPNIRALTRPLNGENATYFPTRGAFGISSDRTPDLGWVYTTPEGQTFRYPTPAPLALGQPPLARPDADFPAGGRAWEVTTALGGSPVLVYDGQVRITATEELVDVENDSRQPRSAIGYTAGGELILLTVDGRQSGFASGATLAEVAQIMLDLGCVAALNLDGGGSTGLVVDGRVANRPSDATGLRPVRSALLITKQNRVYDTEQSAFYAEPDGNWGQTSNAGFFGESPARITPVASPATRTARYTFTDIQPGKYRLGAWWVAAGNRATNTPYILRRGDLHPADTVRFDQSTNGSQFNPYRLDDGTDVFELSAADTLIITNDANDGAAGIFATVDAVKLERVGEPAPLRLSIVEGADSFAVGREGEIAFTVSAASTNTGVAQSSATLYEVFADGTTNGRVIFDVFQPTAKPEALYAVDFAAADLTPGAVALRLGVNDTLGREFTIDVPVTVLPDVEIFFPPAGDTIIERPLGLTFSQDIRIQRTVQTPFVDTLRIFRGADAGAVLLGEPQLISEDTTVIVLDDFLDVPAGDTVVYTIQVADNGAGRFFERRLRVVAVDAPPAIDILGTDSLPSFREDGSTVDFTLMVDSRRQGDTLDSLVIQEVRAGRIQIMDNIAVSGERDTIDYNYTVSGFANETVELRFMVVTESGRRDTARYGFQVRPRRGDMRMVVISDFNGAFGSTDYEWYVDSIVQRIPRLYAPDFIVCGGDMIAGQSSALTPDEVDAMWAGFDRFVAEPIREAGIPFLFTLGNHDGAIPVDIEAAKRYWLDPEHYPGWVPVDTATNYPFYMSFFGDESREHFFIAWNATDATISEEELAWVEEQLESEAARQAEFRFVIGHLPLYAVTNERNSVGNILNNSERLRALLEEHDVHTYVSGHHHAFYPAKRGALELMNAGAAGPGNRSWIGTDERSPNTVTIMDVYHADNPRFGKDTIVYTTYETAYRDAADMPVFDPTTLPGVIFGFNGEYQLRRDLTVSAAATGQLSAINLRRADRPTTGEGNITTRTAPMEGTILIEGSFADLDSPLLPEATAAGLYRGRHGEEGELLAVLDVDSEDGLSGTFFGNFDGADATELLTIGAYYVLLRTVDQPDGAIRSQLYSPTNMAPATAPFTDSLDAETVQIRNEPAVLIQEWMRAPDPETDPVTYTYQAALDESFERIVYHRGLAQQTRLVIPESELYALIDSLGEDDELTLYRRVIATDGRNQTVGRTTGLTLRSSEEAIVGDITLPAPDYAYDGEEPFGQTGFSNGHGITVDRNGRVWAGAYSGGLRVFNADGSQYRPSSTAWIADEERDFLQSFIWKGDTIAARFIRGIGRTNEGDVLIALQNSDVYLFAAGTGEPLAAWDGPTSLSNPTVDSLGRVFVTSVVGNRAFLLERPDDQPDTLVVARPEFTLNPRPGVIRAAAISHDGRRIFLPSNGDPNVNIYNEVDTGYASAGNIATANSSNSITTMPGGEVYTVVNRGQTPPSLVYRRYADGRTLGWQLELDEIESTDLRGVTVTPSRDTFYIVSSSDGGIHRYVRAGDEDDGGTTVDSIAELTIPEARTFDDMGRNVRDGQYVALNGTTLTPNQSPRGLRFYLAQLGAGLEVYTPRDTFGYDPIPGDSLRVFGFLRQVTGQLRLEIDSLRLIDRDRPLPAPVNELTEAREGYLVVLDNVRLTDDWNGGGYLGFTAGGVTADDTEVGITVGRQTELFELPAPRGRFRITGMLDQQDLAEPFDAGYRIRPLSAAAIEQYIDPSLTVSARTGNCVGDTITLSAATEGNIGDAPRYTWLRNNTIVATTNMPDYVVADTGAGDHWQVRVQAGGDNTYYGYAAADSSETSEAIPAEVGALPEVLSFTHSVPATVGQDVRLIATARGAAELRFFGPDGQRLTDGIVRDAGVDDSGVYTAVAISNLGCRSSVDSLRITIEVPLSTIDVATLLGIRFYPNPGRAGTPGTLELTRPLGRLTLHLTDVAGREVWTRTEPNTHVGTLALPLPSTPGLYVLTLASSEGRGSLAVIVR